MALIVVFMGTPEFAVPTLDILIKKKFNILKVYTQPPKKSKRGQKINSSPIENFCKKNKINFGNPARLDNEDEFNIFKKLLPDIVIVVAYGQIIPKNFLTKTKFGFINIHGSLLPKWRGAAPIQRALLEGEETTGLTTFIINKKIDDGEIILQKELK